VVRTPSRLWIFLVLGATTLGLVAQAQSPELQAALRAGDLGEVVRSFALELDTALRRLAAASGCEPAGATRVLPVIDAQTGRCLGGAQVSGPREQLDEAHAVMASMENGLTCFEVVTEAGPGGRQLGPEVGLCGLITVGGE